jgi:signal transduction histidine kinase
LGVGLGAVLIAVLAVELGRGDLGGAAWLAYGLSAIAALAVICRRRRPMVVFALTLSVALIAIALVPPAGAVSLPVVIAVYTLAQHERRWRALTLAALAGVALALARGLLQYRGWSDARTAVEPALVLAALFLGWAVANRRAYVAEMQARAVQAERLRIARELHDVLAHGIATISVQAGVAAHVLHDRPEHAEQALRTIKATSRQALGELRGILGVLRQAGEDDSRAPAPGLGRLESLLQSTIDAGVSTRIVISGECRPLPAGVDLAAYRIVQEALANVLRHAGRASAVVGLAYGDEDVTITVEDDGPGRRRPHGASGHAGTQGHGILGMRERALALGGELQVGPSTDSGYRVHARLPIVAGS